MRIKNGFFHTCCAEEICSGASADVLIGVDAKYNLTAFKFPFGDFSKEVSVESFSGFFDTFLFSKVPSVLLVDSTGSWAITGSVDGDGNNGNTLSALQLKPGPLSESSFISALKYNSM